MKYTDSNARPLEASHSSPVQQAIRVSADTEILLPPIATPLTGDDPPTGLSPGDKGAAAASAVSGASEPTAKVVLRRTGLALAGVGAIAMLVGPANTWRSYETAFDVNDRPWGGTWRTTGIALGSERWITEAFGDGTPVLVLGFVLLLCVLGVLGRRARTNGAVYLVAGLVTIAWCALSWRVGRVELDPTVYDAPGEHFRELPGIGLIAAVAGAVLVTIGGCVLAVGSRGR